MEKQKKEAVAETTTPSVNAFENNLLNNYIINDFKLQTNMTVRGFERSVDNLNRISIPKIFLKYLNITPIVDLEVFLTTSDEIVIRKKESK